MLLVLVAGRKPERPAPCAVVPSPGVPAEAVEPLRLPTPADLQVHSYPERRGRIVADALDDAGPVVLARGDDVLIRGVGRNLLGQFPDIPSDDANDPAPPMIWPPRKP